MKSIQIDHAGLTVSYAGETIQLLPKEHALLAYLLLHPNRTFTRDDLLDAVWPLEAPSDRTVDDHIYRLRKRLKDWSHVIIIETIRGRGYQLQLKEVTRTENPLRANEELRSEFTNLFSIYLRYGQGQALETLAQNQDILGFELDAIRKYYLQFMTGDFKRLVEEDHEQFWDKAFYLLHLYNFISPNRSFDFVKKAIPLQKLPPLHQKELESYNLVSYYLEHNQVILAEEKLQEVKRWVFKENLKGLIPIIHILELQLSLHQKQENQIIEQLKQCEAIFHQYPFLREKGSYFLLKGVWQILSGHKSLGIQRIEEGLDILKQTKFVPHLLGGITKLLQYLHQFQLDSKTISTYEGYWNDLCYKYQLKQLEPQLSKLLESYL